MTPAEQTPADAAPRRPVFSARLERILEHTADTRSLFLRLEENAEFSFTPGQFISLSLPLVGETRVRPYSIASSPEDGQPLEICLNLVPGGLGSHYLFDLRVGDRLSFTGPFGSFTLDHPPDAETVFVAEATAIAPIRPMIRRALAHASRPRLVLLYAAPTEAELLYRREFEDWAGWHAGFSFEPILLAARPGSGGARASLRQQVEARYIRADADRSRHFYVCGVGKPVFELRDLLRGAGYQRRAVHYERW